MREANKDALADAIWAAARGDETPVLCEDESASITQCSRQGLTSSETTVTEGDGIQPPVHVSHALITFEGSTGHP